VRGSQWRRRETAAIILSEGGTAVPFTARRQQGGDVEAMVAACLKATAASTS